MTSKRPSFTARELKFKSDILILRAKLKYERDLIKELRKEIMYLKNLNESKSVSK